MSIPRNNCEELRSTLSQRHQDEVFVERHEQLRMKEEQKKKEAEVESFYADMWAKDIAVKSKKEEETAREQIEKNRETLKVLEFLSTFMYHSNEGGLGNISLLIITQAMQLLLSIKINYKLKS